MKDTSGFTVVEIMIATALISLLIALILPQMFQMYRVDGSSSISQKAVVHAKTVMELIQSEWNDNSKFMSGSLPTLPSPPANVTCQPPIVTVPKMDAYVTTDSSLRKRVKLICTLQDPAQKRTFTFVQEFGGYEAPK